MSRTPFLRVAFLVSGLVFLGACSTPPAEPPRVASAGSGSASPAVPSREVTSGSRLPGPARDRSVRQVGNAGAAEMVRAGQQNPLRGE